CELRVLYRPSASRGNRYHAFEWEIFCLHRMAFGEVDLRSLQFEVVSFRLRSEAHVRDCRSHHQGRVYGPASRLKLCRKIIQRLIRDFCFVDLKLSLSLRIKL